MCNCGTVYNCVQSGQHRQGTPSHDTYETKCDDYYDYHFVIFEFMPECNKMEVLGWNILCNLDL